MQLTQWIKITAILACASICQVQASTNHSKQAIRESGNAASASTASAGHSLVASGQAVVATAAIPFLIVGSAGLASSMVAGSMLNAADLSMSEPLPVCEETFTALPSPAEALSNN
ncbi:hypothetical protein [Veronia pacifica]|uniref:Uncharacterized protein n=1 Tax=Veronia pacifica TaxID=1080227 RepID=A0A1C3EPU2_9GAMM|nr:hypothetical protein [Veronia pacifica]ODA35245.1 hypothetical protein A8L45_04860 [Veronia pacifica]